MGLAAKAHLVFWVTVQISDTSTQCKMDLLKTALVIECPAYVNTLKSCRATCASSKDEGHRKQCGLMRWTVYERLGLVSL